MVKCENNYGQFVKTLNMTIAKIDILDGQR